MIITKLEDLPRAIREAAEGATILVNTEAKRELGERAACRMNRGDLVFEVKDDEPLS